jgi:Regulator of ribonuclease activity B
MTAGEDSLLARQLALTEALWAELERQGVDPGVRSPVDAFFFAAERGAAEQLATDFVETDGWRAFIAEVSEEEPPRWIVKVVTHPLVIGREVFLELAKIMVAAAVQHGCDFDGFGLSRP